MVKIKVYYHDTDCGGVVYYSNYLKYFEQARTEFFEERGLSVKDLMNSGVWFVVSSANLNYKAPGKYGDVLDIDVKIEKATQVTFEVIYIIKNSTDNRLLVEGSTKMVCVNSEFRPMKIPDDVRKKLGLPDA